MEIKRETSYVRSIRCPDVYCDSQADYILPDYLGGVRKILFTDATIRPAGRFAGGEEVEFSGVVVYNVIYLDEEGRLSSAEFTSDYDYSVKCSEEDYRDSVSDTKIAAFSVRLVGPRKMSARCSLVGCVRLSEKVGLSIDGDVFEGEYAPEVDTRLVKIRNTTSSAVCEREYAEEMTRIDGAMADEVSVVYSTSEYKPESCEMCDEGARVKGKLKLISVIYVGDDAPTKLERQISVDEVVPLDNLKPTAGLVPRLTVSSLRTEVNATETGCEVVSNLIADISVLAEHNETVELTLDCYLKSSPTDNSYEDLSYQTLSSVCSSSHSHTANINIGDSELCEISDVIFLTATPKIDRVQLEDGDVKLSGEIKYSGVATTSNSDSHSYAGVKFSSPFEINVKYSSQNDEKTQIEPTLNVNSITAHVDDGNLIVDAVLDLLLTAASEKSVKILSSSTARVGEEYDKTGGVITVYYPNESDTLFSVAKRFHTSGLKIARDNDVSDQVFAVENENGTLKGIRKLLIY